MDSMLSRIDEKNIFRAVSYASTGLAIATNGCFDPRTGLYMRTPETARVYAEDARAALDSVGESARATAQYRVAAQLVATLSSMVLS